MEEIGIIPITTSPNPSVSIPPGEYYIILFIENLN